MAGPQKSSTFSFGQASGNPAPSMFGQTATTSQPQAGGLFGSAPNPPATSGGDVPFGSNVSGATGGPSLFGSTPATSSGGGGPFGSTPTSTAAGGGGFFGSTPTSTAAGGGGLFAGMNPAGGGGSGFNAFGGANKTDSSSTSFGQPSRTSTAPPGMGLFGSNPASSQATQPASAATSSAPFSFETPNKDASHKPAQAATPFGSTTSPQGGSMFSLNTSSSTTPASKPTATLFGSTTPAGPPPIGGIGGTSSTPFPFTKPPGQNNQAPKAPSSSAGAPSMFGNVPQSSSSSNPLQSPSTSTAAPPSIFDTTPKASAPPGGGLFSNLGKPQENAAAPKSNLFSPLSQTTAASSTTPASTPPNAAPKPSAAPFSFMKPSEPASSGPAVSSPAPSSGGGGFSLGNHAITTSAPANSSAPAPDNVFSLGKPQASATTTSAPTSSAPAQTSNLFSSLGKHPAMASNAPHAPAQEASTPATSGAAQAPTMPQATNMSASTAGPAPPAASRLKNKSMDEIITRWATDLSKYQKEFQTQAEKVAHWDRQLVDNSVKIQKLYGQTLEAERTTAEVERQLSVVENDQDELESWLNHYEKEVDEMIKAQGDAEVATGPDAERQKTYQLAGNLQERLDEMGKDLGSMIEEINDASSNLSKKNKQDDPLSQVVRVLNSHLSQLQEIDQGAAALSLKVQEAQKASRAFGSTNGNGMKGLGGPSSAAADGFWKSYTGRK